MSETTGANLVLHSTSLKTAVVAAPPFPSITSSTVTGTTGGRVTVHSIGTTTLVDHTDGSSTDPKFHLTAHLSTKIVAPVHTTILTLVPHGHHVKGNLSEAGVVLMCVAAVSLAATTTPNSTSM